jgi:uncharacterized Zn finger protein (UPF0148 family)
MKKIQNSDQIETWQTTRKTKKKAETIKKLKRKIETLAVKEKKRM